MNRRTVAWLWFAAALAGMLLLGWLDWNTGYELNFFVFYFLPISVGAWFLGFGYSLTLAALCTTVWFAADVLSGHSYPSYAHAVWNTAVRLVSFLAIGWSVSRMRQALVRERDTGKDLRRALGELQEHDRHMAEFVANVSHELNSPLASVTAIVDNLLGGVVGPLSEKLREYVLMLRDDCERLRGTVSDVLDLCRMDAKRVVLNPIPTDLNALAHAVVQDATFLAERKRQELRVEPHAGNLTVKCDAAKIRRALLNIVRNAIKFTPEGGHVVIAVDAEQAAVSCSAALAVTDDGIGVSPEHMSRITERYYRGSEGFEGSGLGLAISKEIVELHGGRIEIKSPPRLGGRGTVVTIRIPCRASGSELT